MNFSTTAFLLGLPVGFLFSFAMGPIFFMLLKSSLENGLRYAIFIIFGVVVADAVLLSIAYGGVGKLFSTFQIDFEFWVQILGGTLLLILGLVNILKKKVTVYDSTLEKSRLIVKNISKGFFINILNPINFFEWAGTVALLKSKYHYTYFENMSFFGAALLGVFLTEFFIVFFAARLRHFIKPSFIKKVNFGTGILFIGFSAWLFWEAFT